MPRGSGWAVVVALCCAAGAAAGAEQTDARLRTAQKSFDEAVKLREAGKYAEAIAQGEHALALREEVLGRTHPEAARCLGLLGGIRLRQGDAAGAEPLLQRALDIQAAALGKRHPDVATALHELGRLYSTQGLYSRAEPLYAHALAIREAALGKNHPGGWTSSSGKVRVPREIHRSSSAGHGTGGARQMLR
jgi:tetratricopeptide (TPR) repeat protein